jgi:hypothetical protein
VFLCYVDESGDTGIGAGASTHFILTAMVVHELRWLATLDTILGHRRVLRQRYGFKVREELHAQVLLFHPGDAARIAKSLRLRMLGEVLMFVGALTDVAVINVVVDKAGKPAGFDVFDAAWSALLQRFHMGVSRRSFAGPSNPDERGLLIADRTDEKKLRLLARRLRRYNPVPSRFGTTPRHMPMQLLVEDPVHRDSQHAYFIQLADVVSYFLKQSIAPNGYVKKKGARHWFNRVDPVLYKLASSTDPHGIVWL